MIREPVASSNISSVGYDAPSETLEVEFSNGTVYQFYNISQGTYDEFLAASSKGQFFNVYIKNAYPYSRVG
ncbi:KTSC domain-containing protein [Dyella silvae]|uniref:KTSC domain-containing protein n=1 Tax=Dyella silvae TaxID=2994424 RepID=UPI00226544A7|nr:KTSC domain-containing protein [Dyella silvae]